MYTLGRSLIRLSDTNKPDDVGKHCTDTKSPMVKIKSAGSGASAAPCSRFELQPVKLTESKGSAGHPADTGLRNYLL